MESKIFRDEEGREWVVVRQGSFLKVIGDNTANEPLYKIAQSCARTAGLLSMKSGMPVEVVNEHRKIWSAIWQRGRNNALHS